MTIQRTLFASGVILALSQSALSSGSSYELVRPAINSGGGSASVGDLVLRTTLGQELAGISRGERYALQVGFWTAREINSIFADGFEATP